MSGNRTACNALRRNHRFCLWRISLRTYLRRIARGRESSRLAPPPIEFLSVEDAGPESDRAEAVDSEVKEDCAKVEESPPPDADCETWGGTGTFSRKRRLGSHREQDRRYGNRPSPFELHRVCPSETLLYTAQTPTHPTQPMTSSATAKQLRIAHLSQI